MEKTDLLKGLKEMELAFGSTCPDQRDFIKKVAKFIEGYIHFTAKEDYQEKIFSLSLIRTLDMASIAKVTKEYIKLRDNKADTMELLKQIGGF